MADTGSTMFGRSAPTASDPVADAPWEPPTFDPSAPVPEVPAVVEPPANLEEAMPTGESFEAGMDSLLDPNAGRTAAGLVKRDRSKSQAPVSEGRKIASSVRSPDEVRSMLARYRSGLKGKPISDLSTPPMPDSPPAAPADPESYDSFDPGPTADGGEPTFTPETFSPDSFGQDSFGQDSFTDDAFDNPFENKGDHS